MHVLPKQQDSQHGWEPVACCIFETGSICIRNGDRVVEFVVHLMEHLVEREPLPVAVKHSMSAMEPEVLNYS